MEIHSPSYCRVQESKRGRQCNVYFHCILIFLTLGGPPRVMYFSLNVKTYRVERDFGRVITIIH